MHLRSATKWSVAFALAIQGAAHAATYRFTNLAGNGGEWNTNLNWLANSGHPVAGDTAVINSGLTANITTPAVATIVRVGHDLAAANYNTGAGTLNIGADLTISNAFTLGTNAYSGTVFQTAGDVTAVNLNIASNAGFTGTGAYTLSSGTLALSAGLAVGTVSTGTFTQSGTTTVSANTINIGANGNNSAYTITGGTLVANNGFSVAGSGSAPASFNVGGTAPDIFGASFAVGALGTLKFALGADGVAGINLSSELFIAQGAKLIIDGSSYAGGAGAFTLVDASAIGGQFWNGVSSTVSFTGFAPQYKPQISYDWTNGDLTLNVQVPEPASTTLLAAGMATLAARRRRRPA